MATPQALNPARTALAKAIAEEAAAKQRADAARAAITRARANVDHATSRLEAARNEAARAKNAQTERAVTAAKAGTPLTPDRATREARARETEAADDLEAAQSAREQVEEALTQAEAELDSTAKSTARAAAVVMAGAVDLLLRETDELQTQVVNRRIILHHLSGIVGTDEHGREIPSIEGWHKDIDDFLAKPFLLSEQYGAWKNDEALTPWRRAYDQLLRDPNAPLPTL
jgi:chromosome segregation ATPase